MFVLGYLCVSGVFFIAAMLFFAGRERWLLRYMVLSGALIAAFGALFVALSVAMGLMQFGVAASYSYPGDYLAAGPAGWPVMLLPIAGVLSPVGAALALRSRSSAVRGGAA